MLENQDRNYRNRNIYFLSDSHAAIRALSNNQIISKLACDCQQPLTQLAEYNRVNVRFEVFMVLIMKNGVFWDVTLCGSCKKIVTANVVPSSPILVTLMVEALCSSKISVLTRATRHNIPEDGILHNRVKHMAATS
jgi:hypothetical protein